jgi:hypothetical protein
MSQCVSHCLLNMVKLVISFWFINLQKLTRLGKIIIAICFFIKFLFRILYLHLGDKINLIKNFCKIILNLKLNMFFEWMPTQGLNKMNSDLFNMFKGMIQLIQKWREGYHRNLILSTIIFCMILYRFLLRFICALKGVTGWLLLFG